MRVACGKREGDRGFVVAGEFLGLDLRFDRGLDHGFDLEKAFYVFTDLAWSEGRIGSWEILFVHAVVGKRRVFPCFIRGVGENGREQTGDTTKYLVHRRLRGKAARGIRRVAIHAVFQRINVDRGKICGAELVDRVENFAELKRFVSREAFFDDDVKAFEDPGVKKRD